MKVESPSSRPEDQQIVDLAVRGPRKDPDDRSSVSTQPSHIVKQRHGSQVAQSEGGPYGSQPNQADLITPNATLQIFIRVATEVGFRYNNGLGCPKLSNVLESFLPDAVKQMHHRSYLKRFTSNFIKEWRSVELTVNMTCGSGMPCVSVKAYEFVPQSDTLVVQFQYETDRSTNKIRKIRKKSPPLGIMQMEDGGYDIYAEYVTCIVDQYLEAFGALCWREDDNDFQPNLFKLMSRVKLKDKHDDKLVRYVLCLIVVTFILSHVITMAEEGKQATLKSMSSYAGDGVYPKFASPRMLSRQMKSYFLEIQHRLLSAVLHELREIFASSTGSSRWLAAFIAILGLCMALEDQQKLIHSIASTNSATQGWDEGEEQRKAEKLCRDIDACMDTVQQLFCARYNHKGNSILKTDRDWEDKAGFGDQSSVEIVRLITENEDYLKERAEMHISSDNQTKYTARLVARFLLKVFCGCSGMGTAHW